MMTCKIPSTSPPLTKQKITLFPRSLSSSALAALQVFYAERDENARKYAALQQVVSAVDDDDDDDDGDGATPVDEVAVKDPPAADAGELSMDIFAENWNDSQFWVCPPALGV